MSYDEISSDEIPLTVNPFDVDTKVEAAYIEGTNISPVASVRHIAIGNLAEELGGFTYNLFDNDMSTYYHIGTPGNSVKTGYVLVTLPFKTRPMLMTSFSYALSLQSAAAGGCYINLYVEISEDGELWKTINTHTIGAVAVTNDHSDSIEYQRFRYVRFRYDMFGSGGTYVNVKIYQCTTIR